MATGVGWIVNLASVCWAVAAAHTSDASKAFADKCHCFAIGDDVRRSKSKNSPVEIILKNV